MMLRHQRHGPLDSGLQASCSRPEEELQPQGMRSDPLLDDRLQSIILTCYCFLPAFPHTCTHIPDFLKFDLSLDTSGLLKSLSLKRYYFFPDDIIFFPRLLNSFSFHFFSFYFPPSGHNAMSSQKTFSIKVHLPIDVSRRGLMAKISFWGGEAGASSRLEL